MHIDFKRLTLHNFISFGHAELDIKDSGFIRVTGVNENPDDLAVSNGSGKSSLWEGIVWCLTGETIRGTKQVSNLYGDDGTFVELEFTVDNVPYKILRSKEHKEYKTTLRIEINGQDCSGKGIRDSEKLLTQYLPDMTPSLLGSVIILGQGLPQKFTNNTPSGRKEVLEKLSKSDFMIEDLKSRVAERKKELQDVIRQHQDKRIELESSIATLESQIRDTQLALSSMNSDELEKKITDMELKLNNLSTELDNELKEIDEYTKEANELFESNQLKLSQINSGIKSEKSSRDDAVAPLEDEINVLRGNKSAHELEIRRLKSVTDVCPTCGQKIPNIQKPDTSALETELSAIEEVLEKKLTKKKELDQFFSDSLQKLQSRKDSIESEYRKEHNENSCLLSAAQQCANQIRVQLAEYKEAQNKVKVELAQFDATKKFYNDLIAENSNTIHNQQSELLYINSEEEKQQQRLSIVNKFDTALKRDFRGYLLTNVIQYIESRAKQYSKIIFETDKVGFTLEGNNIDINYMGKAYENLSGGEKQKIDLIIQFSIRDMLCNHLGFTSNILVLDEVFDGLDMIGCQRVLDVISNISDIKNIFIVTHRKDLSIPTDEEIVVVKSVAGISELK